VLVGMREVSGSAARESARSVVRLACWRVLWSVDVRFGAARSCFAGWWLCLRVSSGSGLALACRGSSRRGGGKRNAWSALRMVMAKLAFVAVRLCEVEG